MARQKQQRSVHWAAYLWPGLPHLWIGGSWAGLALAIGFGVLLNLLLVTTFVWTEWLPPRVKLACAAILGVIWLAALMETRRELRRIAAQRQQQADNDGSGVRSEERGARSEAERQRQVDKIGSREETPVPIDDLTHPQAETLFCQAQAQYLAGDWLAAEQTLLELLRLDRRDVEAQLMLATLWRHSGRFGEAERQLCRLERLEDAASWRFEIGREQELIAATRDGQFTGNPLPPADETSPMAA